MGNGNGVNSGNQGYKTENHLEWHRFLNHLEQLSSIESWLIDTDPYIIWLVMIIYCIQQFGQVMKNSSQSWQTLSKIQALQHKCYSVRANPMDSWTPAWMAWSSASQRYSSVYCMLMTRVCLQSHSLEHQACPGDAQHFRTLSSERLPLRDLCRQSHLKSSN